MNQGRQLGRFFESRGVNYSGVWKFKKGLDSLRVDIDAFGCCWRRRTSGTMSTSNANAVHSNSGVTTGNSQ
jgi:hypothetical protein